MKTSTRLPTAWQGLLRAAWMAGCVFALLALMGGFQPVSAQAISSFKVVTDVTPFHFNVNGTDIFTTGTPNVTSELNTSGNNTLVVGWDPPSKGTPIDVVYTGPSGAGFGSSTLNTGDILRIYSIGGVFLTNEGGITAASSPGVTLTSWTGMSTTADWQVAHNGEYTGYENSPPFAGNDFSQNIAYTDTGTFEGKNFANANKWGTFNFGAFTLGDSSIGTFLGLDVFGDVIHTNGTTDTANTGRIRIQGFGAVPEGSSVLILAFGLVPLIGVRMFIRRKTSPVT